MTDGDDGAPDYVECECERGRYDRTCYSSCYVCYLERRADYIDCFNCGRWHNPAYALCYECRGGPGGLAREEAAQTMRRYIFHRDDYTCCDCGSREGLQVDHVKPCVAGGDAYPWNLQTLCEHCNRVKAGIWWDGCRWARRRDAFIAEYFIGEWRGVLDDRQLAALRVEMTDWRRRYDWPRESPYDFLGARDRARIRGEPSRPQPTKGTPMTADDQPTTQWPADLQQFVFGPDDAIKQITHRRAPDASVDEMFDEMKGFIATGNGPEALQRAYMLGALVWMTDGNEDAIESIVKNR